MAYEKQTWDTTSFVNPTRLNHIEDGIKEVEESTYSVRSAFVSQATPRVVKGLSNGGYCMMFVYGNGERCGIWMGRYNSAWQGTWVVPLGATITCEIVGNEMRFSTASSVNTRLDLVCTRPNVERFSIE